MNELIGIQNININQSINEGLEILFFHILQETKSKYAFYMLRYPPDREWTITDLYFENNEKNNINETMMLRSNILNKHDIIKEISFIKETIQIDNIKCFNIPANLLHPNIQIIVVLINYSGTNDTLITDVINKYIILLSIQFLKKYVNNIINESNTSIVKTLTKIKIPIYEIMESKTLDLVKKSSLSLAMVINDLIDLYKLKRNKLKLNFEETNIINLINEIQKIVNFKYVSDEIPDVLFIDSKRLKQILLNLLTSNSVIIIDCEMKIDIDENDNEFICWSIDFVIENPETLIDERLFIIKKLISLMGGFFTCETDTDGKFELVKFNIEAYKDQKSYSDGTLRYFKGKKILIIDSDEKRRIELGHQLQKWEFDISFASRENEGTILLNRNFDLYIIGINSFIDKLNKFNITKPYLRLLDTSVESDPHSKTDYYIKDVTPVNSPRLRKISNVKPNILPYPSDSLRMLSVIAEVLS